MNIFVTNKCPIISAQEQCDVHNRKMICESVQLLSTAHYVLDGVQVGYKPTHQNHPSNIWTRNSSANYQWLYTHYKALCDEYTFRTGKVHKSSELLSVLSSLPKNIKDRRPAFALCVPEQFQRLGLFDQTISYRAYLNVKLKEWACREKPIKVEWTNPQTTGVGSLRVGLLFILLSLQGCNFQSPDYHKIMIDCAQKKGYYFSVTVPTWLGPRLIAGCAEDFSKLKVTVIDTVSGEKK